MKIHRFKSFKINEEEKTITLSKDLIKKISEAIKNAPAKEFYWDYRDQLSDDQVGEILDAGNTDELFDDIWELNIDAIFDLEVEQIKDAMEEFSKDIKKELDDEDIDLAELAKDMRDEFLDYTHIDLDLKQLAKNTTDITCRVVMKSNYEGLKSNHDNTYYDNSGYEYTDYFKQLIDTLMLNPAKVKAALEKNNTPTVGKFPDIKKRDGEEYVSYKDLIQELENNGSLCELVFLCKINVGKLVDKKEGFSKFVVPKGNDCGLFSSWVGGGSLLGMELLKDFTVDLKKHGATEYDKFEIVADKSTKYSIDDTYGTTSAAFGKPIEFK